MAATLGRSLLVRILLCRQHEQGHRYCRTAAKAKITTIASGSSGLVGWVLVASATHK